MARTLGRLLAGVSLALLCATIVQAAAADKSTKKDPVELAFTLPKSVKLSDDQQKQFDDLRTQKGGELQAALDEFQAAKDSAGKSAAMKKVNAVKKDIKLAIAKILHPKSGTGTKKPLVERKPIREKPAVTKPKREPITKPKKEKPIRLGKLTPGQPDFRGNPPADGGF